MLFFLTCSLPEELYRSWLTDCSAQEEWENMIQRLHQVHILSLPLHLFFFFYVSYILYFWSLSTEIIIAQNGPLYIVSYDLLYT